VIDTDIVIHDRGSEFPVQLDSGRQEFVVQSRPGETLRAGSVAGLREQLSKLPRVRTSVPFTEMTNTRAAGNTLATGVITGVHANGRELLVRYSNGAAGTISKRFAMDDLMPELTPEDMASLERLNAKFNDARERLRLFHREHIMDMWDRTQKEMRG
jgi:hypothetical protein